MNEIFVTDNPFFHLHISKRLLSKFHGPFFSTHSIWYWELNLNWKIFFPTSTILRSELSFQADLRVLFNALKDSSSTGDFIDHAHHSIKTDQSSQQKIISPYSKNPKHSASLPHSPITPSHSHSPITHTSYCLSHCSSLSTNSYLRYEFFDLIVIVVGY